jgi:hypothetical protein
MMILTYGNLIIYRLFLEQVENLFIVDNIVFTNFIAK